MSLHPTSDLVAVAWLRSIPGLGGRAATVLPQDNSSWAASGFVQATVIGGTPEHTMPVAKPVVSLDFWAVNPASNSPPWNRANQLAEIVRAAVLDHPTTGRTVTLPATYTGARVLTAFYITEPRRVRADPADYAHYSADLELHWVETP